MRKDFEWVTLEDVFQEYYPDLSFTRSFIISIWKNFSGSFSDNALANFMMIACENTETSEGATKYFCAICWRKIKSGDLGEGEALLQRRYYPKQPVDKQAEKTLH